ncbi:response regulator transcription factor [Leucobacter luti]|uniref:LuxR family two component transcriptional regulator n=1 Tax=Leucobacter luti TaxID=340320 RepID=A0A4Q7U561_9MICO|nr:response regulator [Leucobacter luti]MBL3701004.1 DNA-binding response regulator [Leucobacter luti]RZT68775.1 LuxR family two component transcriptional regulator [Leucobacter luti]
MSLTHPQEAAPRERVFIVDDDDELRASLEWLLESVGIPSRSFNSAADFLAEFDPAVVACLVTDVRMPGLSGLRLQEILRDRGIKIPTIFVSAHGSIRMSVQALQAGALTFLEKPYEPQQLVDLVQDGLARARALHKTAHERARLTALIDALTPREREVLSFVLEGEQSKVIAFALGISTRTVDVHRARIREKTGAASITHLVRDLLQAGLEPEHVLTEAGLTETRVARETRRTASAGAGLR